jgi:hypothetical protein
MSARAQATSWTSIPNGLCASPDPVTRSPEAAVAPVPKAPTGYEWVHSLVDDHSRLAYSELHHNEKATTVAAGSTGSISPVASPTIWTASCSRRVGVQLTITVTPSCAVGVAP